MAKTTTTTKETVTEEVIIYALEEANELADKKRGELAEKATASGKTEEIVIGRVLNEFREEKDFVIKATPIIQHSAELRDIE